MKFAKTTAVAAGAIALVAVGGVGAHAAGGLIQSNQIAPGAVHSHNIKAGAVTVSKLSPWAQSRLKAKGAAKGATGAAGHAGQDGLNPATAVDNVPSYGSNTPTPAVGGDSGFYLTGAGAGGSASLTGGELLLTGSGVDSNTAQGGIGIAKAYNNVPLSSLDALSYDWHLNTPNGEQSPSIHITVTGATADAKAGSTSGFTNLVYSPGIDGSVPAAGVDVTSEALTGGWYSTGDNSKGNVAGSISQPQPLSFFLNNDPNAVIVQISLDNGGSSNGSGAFSAGADDLVVGFTGTPFKRFDFDS